MLTLLDSNSRPTVEVTTTRSKSCAEAEFEAGKEQHPPLSYATLNVSVTPEVFLQHTSVLKHRGLAHGAKNLQTMASRLL